MAFRHGEDIGVVAAARNIDVQHRMLAAFGQGFDEAAFLADAAIAHGTVFAAGRVLHRALQFHHLFEDARGFLRHDNAIDVQDSVLHLDLVARQTDQPLDVIGPRSRMAEDHDIAAFRIGAEDPPGKRAKADLRQRDLTGIARIAVGHLVDEQEVANQQRVFHRFRWNPEWLEEDRAEGGSDHQCPEDGLDRLDDTAVCLVFRHASSASMVWRYMRAGKIGVKHGRRRRRPGVGPRSRRKPVPRGGRRSG
jgi:hypothetical protein